MKIVIIGSGNVASHLAIALLTAKLEVVQIWSKHYENASELANRVNSEALANLSEVDIYADLCLIAVKDDAIASIVNELKNFRGVIAHTSGAVGLDIFAGHFENYGVFYPLQTFSKTKNVNFSTVPICIEANNKETTAVLKDLATLLSNNVFEINSEKRRVLHLAAVFACNFTNHLYALAEKILAAHELNFDILRPLINETASKVQEALPTNVQTGPAIRDDKQTMKKHMDLLIEQPQLLELYKTLSESIKKIR